MDVFSDIGVAALRNSPIAYSRTILSRMRKPMPPQEKNCRTGVLNRVSKYSVGVMIPARRHRRAKTAAPTSAGGTVHQIKVTATKPCS
jgi:hypothetical protein